MLFSLQVAGIIVLHKYRFIFSHKKKFKTEQGLLLFWQHSDVKAIHTMILLVFPSSCKMAAAAPDITPTLKAEKGGKGTKQWHYWCQIFLYQSFIVT